MEVGLPYELLTLLREGFNEKKTLSFGHCPNHLNSPPHDPNSGNLVLFFRTSKFNAVQVPAGSQVKCRLPEVSKCGKCFQTGVIS